MADLGKLGEARVEITADTAQYRRAVKGARKQTTTDSKEMANSFDRVRTSIFRVRSNVLAFKFAMAATVIAVAAGIRRITQAAFEQEKAIGQVEARLRSTGGVAGLTSRDLQDLASSLQSVTTFGDEAVLAGEALLLTFTKIGREVFPRAIETALDMSVAMDQDLKSSVLQLGKALNDPVLGVTALTRVGVQFTQEQKDLIKTLVETNEVLEAQKIILQELETQMGSSARTLRETLGGTWKAVFNEIGDLGEKAGVRLLKSIDTPANKILNILTMLNLALENKAKFEAPNKGILQAEREMAEIARQRAEAIALIIKHQKALRQEEKPFQSVLLPEVGRQDLLDISDIPIPDVDWLNKYIESLKILHPLQAEADQLFIDTRNSAEQYAIQMQKLDTMLASGLIDQETYNRGLKRIKEEFKNTANDMTLFAEEAAKNMQNAFADFLFDPFSDGLDGLLQDFLVLLRRMAAEAVAADIFSAIKGDELTFIGGLISLGKGLTGGVTVFARGGVINSPMVFPQNGGIGIAGEAGAEAIIPLKRDSGGNLGVGSTPVNLRIVNATDENAMQRFMQSSQGERVLLNVMNKTQNRLYSDRAAR